MSRLKHWAELNSDLNIYLLTSPIHLPKQKDKEPKEGETRGETEEEFLVNNIYQERED